MITPPQAQGHVNRIASLLFADVASMKRWLSRVNYKLHPMLAILTVPTDDNVLPCLRGIVFARVL